jgi:hypothetical protein
VQEAVLLFAPVLLHPCDSGAEGNPTLTDRLAPDIEAQKHANPKKYLGRHIESLSLSGRFLNLTYLLPESF